MKGQKLLNHKISKFFQCLGLDNTFAFAISLHSKANQDNQG